MMSRLGGRFYSDSTPLYVLCSLPSQKAAIMAYDLHPPANPTRIRSVQDPLVLPRDDAAVFNVDTRETCMWVAPRNATSDELAFRAPSDTHVRLLFQCGLSIPSRISTPPDRPSSLARRIPTALLFDMMRHFLP